MTLRGLHGMTASCTPARPSAKAGTCALRRARSFSAKKDFGALMKMMPLEVMMPTTGQLTLTLPAGGAAEKRHNPFGSLISIAGIKDEVVVMPSLQRPKKVAQLSPSVPLLHVPRASATVC